jgi:site-specific DNA recombinase
MNNFAAIYARSSLGKEKQGDTVEHQVDMIQEFAKRSNMDLIFDKRFIYEDDGESGFKTTLLQRPAMKRMIEDINNGLVKTVFFKGVSRFARDSAEAITTAKRLNNMDVRVISLEENYDSIKDEPTMFQIYAVMAESESRKTSIRVSLGNKQKARNGLWTGTITPLGYSKVKDIENAELKNELILKGKHGHSLFPNEHAFIITKIFEMFVNEGLGRKRITSKLNELGYKTIKGRHFQEKTVLDILRNEAYIGNIVYGKTRYNYIEDEEKQKKIQRTIHIDESDWIRVTNAHPAIVEKEIFQRAQELLNIRKGKFDFGRKFNARKHPLTGILICDKCNANMICQKRTNTKSDGTKIEYRYYVCSTYHKQGRNICDQANTNADMIEEFLFEKLKSKIEEQLEGWDFKKSVKVKKENMKRLNKEVQQIELQLQKKLNSSKGLLEFREQYDIETFITLNAELQNEIKVLRERLENFNTQIENDDNDGIINLHEMYELFKAEMFNEHSVRRQIFHKLINQVRISGADIVLVDSEIDLSL